MFDRNSSKRSAGAAGEPVEAETLNHSPASKPPSHERAKGIATIGPSIHIKGDLSGEEDLVVQGNVEGTITLNANNLTIGQEGTVNANIQAHTIIVEGTLKGDAFGEEKVTIKRTGNVQGNVSAPRVSLEDGAKFKGSMDMDYKGSKPAEPAKDSASVFKLDNKTSSSDKNPSKTHAAQASVETHNVES